MTDARLRGEWLNALGFDDLSDTAWRVFTCAIMWAAENGTNGLIPTRYLKMLHPDGEKEQANVEIVSADLWSRTENGYQLTDWDGALGQSTAQQVETYKANARKRARDYRERERSKQARALGLAAPESSFVGGDDTRDVTRDVREYVGKGKGEGSGYSEANVFEESAGKPEPKPFESVE
jgi:hypothetical protein